MKIRKAFTWSKHFNLKNPYAITSYTFEGVSLVFIQLHSEDGLTGIGSGSPSKAVCNETPEECLAALKNIVIDRVEGESIFHYKRLIRELSVLLKKTPAAMAAIDMALHDLFCKKIGVSIYNYLGKYHSSLPTSITIGIKELKEIQKDIDEYIQLGFSILKIKIGESVDRDVELLHKIREWFGDQVKLRVDGNQGYSIQTLQKFLEATSGLDIQFVEQPLPVGNESGIKAIPARFHPRIMLDESVQYPGDLHQILRANPEYELVNIKMMKCGGISSAIELATLAQYNQVNLMWGCMDESRISIAAALMTALSQPKTAYLDLDGHIDLSRDIAKGGFIIRRGVMYPSPQPGLGISIIP